MDSRPSPDRLSPDHSAEQTDMATVVAHPQLPNNMPGAVAGINKRYRPAPAKTFQCRGYGECRMVFSRSEHLARHIRKHTGERPFTCHCAKQFSRLDNLRQHAQTVHADKQDQNERMMRDLTSLHASMAAANKVGNPRGGRRPNPASNHSGMSNGNGSTMNLIKQEDLSIPIHQRPGTSTGYEGDLMYQSASWHVQASDLDRPDSRPANNHSFRDPSQSFLAPPTNNSSTAAAAHSQSFLPFTSTLSFGVSDGSRDARPGSSSSRPPTSGGLADSHPRSLPPLSAVVSASIPPSSSQQPFPSSSPQQQQQSSQHVLPFPGSLTLRRPSTATRPGTAPASASLYSKSSFIGGNGMGSRPELSLLSYGRPSELGSHSLYDSDLPQSPAGHDSPFFFSAPESQPTSSYNATSPSLVNPRKRAFAGPDGPYDEPGSVATRSFESGGGLDYDYGSESRPQSRRLSVMELCNDADANAGALGSFLLPLTNGNITNGTGGESRPNTSAGLVSSASALALVDREPRAHSSSPLLSRAAQAAAAAYASSPSPTPSSATITPATIAAAASGTCVGGEEEFGGRGIPSASSRRIPSPPSAATASPSTLLHYRTGSTTGGYTHSPTFSAASTASYSPRSPASSACFSPRSPLSPSDAAAAAISRRSNGADDQVRISLSSHTPTAFGMRV